MLDRIDQSKRGTAVVQNATATYIVLYMSAFWLLLGGAFVAFNWTMVCFGWCFFIYINEKKIVTFFLVQLLFLSEGVAQLCLAYSIQV